MLHFTVSYSVDLDKEILSDLEDKLKQSLQSLFPLHAIFVFFVKSELSSDAISIKIEAVSKKGISEQEAELIIDTTKEVYLAVRKTYNLNFLPVAIWVAPNLALWEVKWINPDVD